jgi:hypothetical protein
MTHSPIKISLRHLNEKIKHFFIRTKNFIRISEAETGRSKPADQNRQIKTGRSKPADHLAPTASPAGQDHRRRSHPPL